MIREILILRTLCNGFRSVSLAPFSRFGDAPPNLSAGGDRLGMGHSITLFDGRIDHHRFSGRCACVDLTNLAPLATLRFLLGKSFPFLHPQVDHLAIRNLLQRSHAARGSVPVAGPARWRGSARRAWASSRRRARRASARSGPGGAGGAPAP